MLVRRAAAFVFAVTMAALVACSSSSTGATTCNGQGQCVCNESCSQKCESGTGGGCDLVCKDGKTCTFDCPGGNCRVSCEGKSTCDVACPKGGCTVAAGSGNLTVACGNLGTCTVGCQGATKCTVDGKSAPNGSNPGDIDAGL